MGLEGFNCTTGTCKNRQKSFNKRWKSPLDARPFLSLVILILNLSQSALRKAQVGMLLPQVFRDFISTTVSCTLTPWASSDWAQMGSWYGIVDIVDLADTICLTLESLGVSGIGA